MHSTICARSKMLMKTRMLTYKSRWAALLLAMSYVVSLHNRLLKTQQTLLMWSVHAKKQSLFAGHADCKIIEYIADCYQAVHKTPDGTQASTTPSQENPASFLATKLMICVRPLCIEPASPASLLSYLTTRLLRPFICASAVSADCRHAQCV